MCEEEKKELDEGGVLWSEGEEGVNARWETRWRMGFWEKRKER